MPIPTAITSLSETASSNSPPGSENVGPNMNGYIQAAYAFIRQIYDGSIVPLNPFNMNSQKITNVANGVAGTDAVNMNQLAAYLPLAGGTVSGSLTVSGSVTAASSLTVNNGQVIAGNGSLNSEVDLKLSNTNTLGWVFLRSTDGGFGFYDNTRGVLRFSSDTGGNFTANGNLAANSDERLKTDWESLPDDFIERLAAVRSGTYTRIDTDQRHVGVGAQSLQLLMPEAVLESDEGTLSVAYGQAALAACVELAKDVVRLRALLEAAR